VPLIALLSWEYFQNQLFTISWGQDMQDPEAQLFELEFRH
jgi:hypothetical protein